MSPISRRSMLVGGAAALGAGLWGAGRKAAADASGPARNLILVVASGGWDTTYALDPKPGSASVDAPAGEITEFEGIPIFTDPSRPAVTAFFEAFAGVCAVVNGVQTQSIVHSDCAKRVLTGTPSDTNPDIGAITAFELGRDLPVPYLVLGQTSYTGPYASIAARAGTANQIGTLLDPYFAYPIGGSYAPRFAPDMQESEMMRAYVTARAEREKALRGQVGHNRARIEDFVASMERADALAELGMFGDFTYTRDLTVQADLALSALEQGLSHVVHIELGDWDTHDLNALQTERHETFYTGLAYLLNELATRPGKKAGNKMLEETVVAVVSEMGRTPLLNANQGKDHWPVTSALVLGAGVAGGRTVGQTNAKLEAASIDMTSGDPSPDGKQLQYGNLAAGLLQLVGVDASLHLPNSEPLHAICA